MESRQTLEILAGFRSGKTDAVFQNTREEGKPVNRLEADRQPTVSAEEAMEKLRQILLHHESEAARIRRLLVAEGMDPKRLEKREPMFKRPLRRKLRR